VHVDGYTDADWAGNVSDRKSTSGYFTFVGGNLVTWRSNKQKVVALSSAKAEFRGMAKGLCELLWLKRLLTKIGIAPSSEMNLFCDNKAAIDIPHNLVQHDRIKHVEVDQHFIKQNLNQKKLFGSHSSNLKTSWRIYLQKQCPLKSSTTHLTSWA